MTAADGKVQLEVGLKRAIEWIGETRRDNPSARLGLLIDEAARKFDLSPAQADFLYRHFAPKPTTSEPR
ncbi:MAG: hypothetical protein ACE147_04650 [Candidatus Methylomirabilales bacterium]